LTPSTVRARLKFPSQQKARREARQQLAPGYEYSQANAVTAYHPHPQIRPSPEYLKTLPTLRVLTPDTTFKRYRKAAIDYRLELKMETVMARFWLIARCSGEPFKDWREGNVLVETVQDADPDEHEMVPYGSGDVKRLQRMDYFWMLRAEFERLLAEPWSWEREKRLKEVREEMQRVAYAILDAEG
jgi:hypothetical protein